MNNIIDQQKIGGTGSADCAMKFPTPVQKPSMGAKLSKVAEIFELDIIDEEEALKACRVIIEQHAKKKPEIVEKIVK